MDYLTVGQIVGTHGIRGEVKVLSRTDFPDVRFRPGSVLQAEDSAKGERVRLEVESSRQHKNVYLLRFKGFGNINDVEKFRGCLLKVPADESVDLPEGEYYFHEIIGCRVLDEDGRELGTVREILRPGANDVWEAVDDRGKSILIPVIEDVVTDVDVTRKEIRIRVMEGML